MHEFQCGHEECRSEFTESNRDGLKRRIAEHLREAHDIEAPSGALMSYLEASCVSEAHGFQCGHEECRSEFTESNRDGLKRRIAEHLREVHDIEAPSGSLMNYLEATCVTPR